jgi:hypothetical protein
MSTSPLEILTGVYNTWEFYNNSIVLYNNFNLSDIDLEQLKCDVLNECHAIIPTRSEIPFSPHNLHLTCKNDILKTLKTIRIGFGNYFLLMEGDGIELGRCDLIFRTIYLGNIVKLTPRPVIKFIIFHELLHLLIWDHSNAFYSILNKYPRKQEIDKYLHEFLVCLKRFYLVKQDHHLFFSIRKDTDLYQVNYALNPDRTHQTLFFHGV